MVTLGLVLGLIFLPRYTIGYLLFHTHPVIATFAFIWGTIIGITRLLNKD